MIEDQVVEEEYPGVRHVTLRKRRWFERPVIAIPIVTALGLLVLGIIFDNILMPWYTKQGSKATVPNVVGLKKDLAMSRLQEAGYEPIQYEVRFDDTVREGLIIRQTPEATEVTKPGRKVFLIISGGKEVATVPDLRGKSLRDAKMMLLKSNMFVGNVSYAYTDSSANGTVFRQQPLPGQKTSASTQVSLVISQGPMIGRVAVPTLAGLSLSEAIAKLKESKLELGQVTYQNGGPVANQVVDSYPPVGDLITEGSSVDVFVYRGGGSPPPLH
jgi:beta-lactam-binding protein with PASTA domain